MMRNLMVTEGEVIQVEYVSLQVARFTKFQPQSVDFLEISNPKAVWVWFFDEYFVKVNNWNFQLCVFKSAFFSHIKMYIFKFYV